MLSTYVTFRRTYETLDFAITYQNNGGGSLPAPSDWDIRLIATVPASELPSWIPPNATPLPTPPDTTWLQSIPTPLDLSGLTEWYTDGPRTIGIDRTRRIIAYRHRKM